VDGYPLAGAGRCEADRAVRPEEIAPARVVGSERKRSTVRDSLTAIIILGTLLHIIVFTVMIWIRVRRTEPKGTTGQSAKITPCAICGEPSTHLGYDGLDPNEQVDSHTGRAWSADMGHYRPVCAAH